LYYIYKKGGLPYPEIFRNLQHLYRKLL